MKELLKMDRSVQKLLLSWISKNLDGCENPYKVNGFKELKGTLRNYVRYRVGDYRLICTIHEDVLIIHVLSVGHRKNIYE